MFTSDDALLVYISVVILFDACVCACVGACVWCVCIRDTLTLTQI